MDLLKKNVGKLDRILRVAFGTGFILAGLIYFSPPISYLSLLLGAIWLFTGLLGACPVYSIIGTNTCAGVCNLQGKAASRPKPAPARKKPGKRKSRKKK